jgi:hypothetical protein
VAYVEDDIKIELKVVGYRGVSWIHVAQYWDKWWDLTNPVMNRLVPHISLNFLID